MHSFGSAAKTVDAENMSAEFSCIFIHVRSPVRQAAIRTVQWPGFDALILVAIVVNCVFKRLAAEVYL